MNGDRLTVMLDFDGVLLMPAYGNQTEAEAHQAGTPLTIDSVLPRVSTAPDASVRYVLYQTQNLFTNHS